MIVPDVSDRTLATLVSLEGRGAAVTGGARGIGYAIARRLAEAGANVLIADINRDGALAAADTLSRQFTGQVIGVELDVCDSAGVSAVADTAIERLGRLDIWVNNAGIYPVTPVLDLTDADWDRVLEVNTRGTFLGAREAGRRMVAAGGGGVIVNLASIAAYRADLPGYAHYVAAKHAVRGLTKSLAVELGPYGIRVLAVAPTNVDTTGKRDDGLDPAILARHPLGRIGVPDDVARVVLFCASDLSVLMTGSTLLVDAGNIAM